MKLLTSQKNELFQLIEETELSPAQFSFREFQDEIQEDVTTELDYIGTDFFFLFQTRQITEHFCTYAPGETEFQKSEYPGSWLHQMGCFKKWLNNLKREISLEDKWKRLESEIHHFDFNFDGDKEKFSAIEYEELCIKIDLIKNKSQAIGLSQDQLLKLNEGMDFLKEKAKNLGKVEWKSLFVGIIVQYIIQLNLPPEVVSNFMKIVKAALKTFLLN